MLFPAIMIALTVLSICYLEHLRRREMRIVNAAREHEIREHAKRLEEDRDEARADATRLRALADKYLTLVEQADEHLEGLIEGNTRAEVGDVLVSWAENSGTYTEREADRVAIQELAK